MTAASWVYAIEERKAVWFAAYALTIALALGAVGLSARDAQAASTAAVEFPPPRHINVQPHPEHNHIPQQPAELAAAPAATTNVAGAQARPIIASYQPDETRWPMHGAVTTEFGYGHKGMDIASRQGSGVTGVAAFRAGQVLRTVRGFTGYGNHVIVDHGDGLTSYYAHLSAIHVTEGQYVKAGDMLGTEGNTGYSTGPHLHLEIRLHDVPVNPRTYIHAAGP